jgi:hypothetical protein
MTLGYTQMQNKDDHLLIFQLYYNGYPLENNHFDPYQAESEIFLRIPYFGAGFEYAVTGVDKKRGRGIRSSELNS